MTNLHAACTSETSATSLAVTRCKNTRKELTYWTNHREIQKTVIILHWCGMQFQAESYGHDSWYKAILVANSFTLFKTEVNEMDIHILKEASAFTSEWCVWS
jgi:hypothetical protein